MKKFLMLIIAVIGLLAVQTGMATAEEELFDTKAASALFDKGMDHLKGNKLDQAVSDFEESISIAPDARTYYFLGYTYYLKGKAGDAKSRKKSIENFDEAYELDPNFTPNRTTPSIPASLQEKPGPKEAAPAQDTGKPPIEVSQPKDAATKQQQ